MRFYLIILINILLISNLKANIEADYSSAYYSSHWIIQNIRNSLQIYVKKGMVTTIQFSNLIKYMIMGDELIAESKAINDHTIFISAKLPNETTNLNVTTLDGNYVFVIKTLDYNAAKEPNLHINVGLFNNLNLSSYYKKLRKERKKTKNNPNFDYSFSMYVNPRPPFKTITNLYCKLFHCDFKKIAPGNIWTDGKFTYLDYRTLDGTLRPIPIIQEVVDGIDVPVNQFNKVEKQNINVTNEEGIIVVHTLSKVLTLVSNGVYLCIKYRGHKYNVP